MAVPQSRSSNKESGNYLFITHTNIQQSYESAKSSNDKIYYVSNKYCFV